MNGSPSRRAGFTLIELLVAIALAALVAVIGALVLRAAIDFHGRAARYVGEGEDLRAADRLLSREWSARHAQGVLAKATMLEFRTDRFAGPYPEGEPEAIRVRYLCGRQGADGMSLERVLLSRKPADGQSGGDAASRPDWRAWRTEVLISNLAACRFAYLQTRQTREGKIGEWRDQAADAQQAPLLVRLILATGRGEIAPLVYAAER